MNSSITFDLSDTNYTTLRIDSQGKSTWLIVCPGGRGILSTAEGKVQGYTSYVEAQKIANSLNDTQALQRVFKDKMPEPMSVPMILPFLKQPEQKREENHLTPARDSGTFTEVVRKNIAKACPKGVLNSTKAKAPAKASLKKAAK